MLILAFDTATEIATVALVADDQILGEGTSRPRSVLADIDALLLGAGLTAGDIDALAVGTGPGSFTSTRIGLAVARGLGVGLGVPAAGISTLAALTAGAEGAVPLIDARRGEVFVAGGGVVRPAELALAVGTECVGDGALRHRELLEEKGLSIPPADDPRHQPRAYYHARLAREFGPPGELEPIYMRAPDAMPRR